MQWSPLSFVSGGLSLGSWGSVDFTEDFQFFPDSYHDNNSFCSPTTPGPGPHYPQTPNISPGPRMLDSDQCGNYPLTFDPSLHHPHLHLNHPDLLQDQDQRSHFSPSSQGGGADHHAALTLVPPTGHRRREESEGGNAPQDSKC
ncbi:hypothetical protein JOB18_029702 [Solea senegalensis]|uniref:Uncharacterized protein n=1 Tax=Solea senegalensis TaxID=28829 RepID=A0AAV6RCG0_SOLSE|nr:hypothetical protein JOB18_029702 [Solea senegalensis]